MHHDVDIRRVLLPEPRPQSLPHGLHRFAEQLTVGAREIDVLEETGRAPTLEAPQAAAEEDATQATAQGR